jgi:hypothetical protein
MHKANECFSAGCDIKQEVYDWYLFIYSAPIEQI